jgi:hypothetical protein
VVAITFDIVLAPPNLPATTLIYCELFDACWAILNSVTLLVADHVPVGSQRDAWVTVPQLLLHHSGCSAVCEQGTGCTMTCRMEPATRNTQLHQQRVKLFFTQLVCWEWTPAAVDEQQVSFALEIWEPPELEPLGQRENSWRKLRT